MCTQNSKQGHHRVCVHTEEAEQEGVWRKGEGGWGGYLGGLMQESHQQASKLRAAVRCIHTLPQSAPHHTMLFVTNSQAVIEPLVNC